MRNQRATRTRSEETRLNTEGMIYVIGYKVGCDSLHPLSSGIGVESGTLNCLEKHARSENSCEFLPDFATHEMLSVLVTAV